MRENLSPLDVEAHDDTVVGGEGEELAHGSTRAAVGTNGIDSADNGEDNVTLSSKDGVALMVRNENAI